MSRCTGHASPTIRQDFTAAFRAANWLCFPRPISPRFIISHNLHTTNISSKLASFCTFFCTASYLAPLHRPQSFRPTPHDARTSGVSSCADLPRRLLPDTDHRIVIDRAGRDRDERPHYLSMTQNRQFISTNLSVPPLTVAACRLPPRLVMKYLPRTGLPTVAIRCLFRDLRSGLPIATDQMRHRARPSVPRIVSPPGPDIRLPTTSPGSEP